MSLIFSGSINREQKMEVAESFKWKSHNYALQKRDEEWNKQCFILSAHTENKQKVSSNTNFTQLKFHSIKIDDIFLRNILYVIISNILHCHYDLCNCPSWGSRK